MSTRAPKLFPRSHGAGLAAASAGALAAAWVDPRALAGYLTVLTAALVFACLPEADLSTKIVRSLATVGYPVAVVEAGENGILWASGGIVIVLAAFHVFRGLRPGSLDSLAVSILGISYFGAFLSYFILIRGLEDGSRLVSMLFALFASSQVAAAVVHSRVPRNPDSAGPDAWEAGAGIALCTGASIAARVALNLPITFLAAAVAGLVVGMAGMAGTWAARLVIRDLYEQTGRAGMVERMNGLVFAAPAFYYALQLYVS